HRNVRTGESARHIIAQEKPVSTPGDITRHAAQSLHHNGYAALVNIGRHVFDRHRIAAVEFRREDSSRRFDPVCTWDEPTKMRQGHDRAYRAVAAHVEKSFIVEEDQPGSARRITRLAQKCAHYGLEAPWLIETESPSAVETFSEKIPALA